MWYRLEDKIPELEKRVLCWSDTRQEFFIDYVIETDDEREPYVWAEKFRDDFNEVTHWMHLPHSPTKKE